MCCWKVGHKYVNRSSNPSVNVLSIRLKKLCRKKSPLQYYNLLRCFYKMCICLFYDWFSIKVSNIFCAMSNNEIYLHDTYIQYVMTLSSFFFYFLFLTLLSLHTKYYIANCHFNHKTIRYVYFQNIVLIL